MSVALVESLVVTIYQGSARHLVTTVSFGVGTVELPKIPLRTAMQRPVIEEYGCLICFELRWVFFDTLR